jgi:hypothetical protein
VLDQPPCVSSVPGQSRKNTYNLRSACIRLASAFTHQLYNGAMEIILAGHEPQPRRLMEGWIRVAEK